MTGFVSASCGGERCHCGAVGVGGFAPRIQTVEQGRPHEAYPELVDVIRMIEIHDGNPIWLTKLRNEIDAARINAAVVDASNAQAAFSRWLLTDRS